MNLTIHNFLNSNKKIKKEYLCVVVKKHTKEKMGDKCYIHIELLVKHTKK